MSLFGTSDGTKRKIAAVLSVLLGIAGQFSGAAQIVSVIQWVASAFGVTGLVHAASAGTLAKYNLASITAAIATLIALLHWIPQAAPLIAPLQYLATLLGAATVGNAIKK